MEVDVRFASAAAIGYLTLTGATAPDPMSAELSPGNFERPLTKRVAVLLALDADDARITDVGRAVLGVSDSVATRVYDYSYGQVQLEGALFPGFVEPTFSNCSSEELRGWAAETDAHAERLGIELGAYTNVFYYFPETSVCHWWALSEVGSVSVPRRDTWLNGTIDRIIITHELLHNWGARHAGARLCVDSGANVRCGVREYGDPFDVMGNGSGHLSGAQKAALGWLSGCNVVDVREPGRFLVEPLESATGGVLTLKVVRRDGSADFVEYRLGEEPRSQVGGEGVVLVRHVASTNQAAPTALLSPRLFPENVDVAQLGEDLFALPPGVELPLETGGRIRVESVGAVGAVVAIEPAQSPRLGERSTCLDGSEPQTRFRSEGLSYGPLGIARKNSSGTERISLPPNRLSGEM